MLPTPGGFLLVAAWVVEAAGELGSFLPREHAWDPIGWVLPLYFALLMKETLGSVGMMWVGGILESLC